MSSMFRKGCIRAPRDAEKDTPLGTRMQVLGKFFETDKTQELALPPRGEQGETTEKAAVPTSDFKAPSRCSGPRYDNTVDPVVLSWEPG